MVVKNNFSVKFVDDLEKFAFWLNDNEYYLNDIVSGEQIQWEINLMSFSEPSRSKLECYVKELIKYYSLVKDNEEIDDIKSMIKEFRQNKPKKIKTKNETRKEIKKETENNDKDEKDNDNVIKKKNKDNYEEIKKRNNDKDVVDVVDVVFNENLDTEDVCYIDTLEFSTKDLEKVFGKPLKNGKENDKHQYEWKLLVIMENEEIIYSIYDWMDKNGNFNSYNGKEWHLGTMKRCLNDKNNGCECHLSIIINFIKIRLNKLEQEQNTINQKDQEQDKEKVIKKLFNLTEIEPEIIDIDDICF